MATDKFVPGDLVLVDFPGSGYWPCRVSRIMSKNWRKVQYFGGGEEIGKAHVQVIRDYDEATKDDLEEFIPKIKMDEDPILRQAVKQINQKFTGKKTKIRGVKKGTRNETKRMSDKIENCGKQNLQKTSDKKQMTAATNETRKTRGKKEFIVTNKETKKNTGELEKKKIAKKAFIGTRNKTKKITGITKIISTTNENDTKKENPRSLRAGESDMRGSDGLIKADSPERDQSRPNNENINSHLLLNGGSNSTNNNIETSTTRLGSSCCNNNFEVPSSGAIDNSNSDICGASVSTPISQGTLVNNNHGVADDVDIIIKCEVDENAVVPDSSASSDYGGAFSTEDIPAQEAPAAGSSASTENGGAFSTEDISAQEAPAAGCSASSENGGAFSTEENSAQEAPAAGSSASSENGGAFSTEDNSAQEAPAAGSSASSENGGAFSTEDISAQEAPAAGSSASTQNSGAFSTEENSALEAPAAGCSASSENSGSSTEDISAQEAPAAGCSASSESGSSTEDISANNLGDPEQNTDDTVRLNISMQMSPNTFSQISPALLTFVSQPNVTVHINVPL